MKVEYEKYFCYYYIRNIICKYLRGYIVLGRKDSYVILECRFINKYDDFDFCLIFYYC